MSDRLLTGAEVAERLNMPQATLRYWRHVGEGPKSFRLGPRRVMYRERDVELWLDEQYRAETSQQTAS
jgi:predicted DNA-binding transcriptional regulator AlpA